MEQKKAEKIHKLMNKLDEINKKHDQLINCCEETPHVIVQYNEHAFIIPKEDRENIVNLIDGYYIDKRKEIELKISKI